MPYRKVQCVGYVVDTSPAGPVGAKLYLGSPTAKVDIAKRCKIMKFAINQAAADPNIDASPQTLKIFMAPEFFFRGAGGAYPIELVSSILEDLRQVTRRAAYKNWLFVFGTALGFLDAGATKEIFNLALVQKGGTDKVDVSTTLIVYKEYISHIDFIRLFPAVRCSCGGVAVCSTCASPLNFTGDWDSGIGRTALLNGKMELLSPVEGSRDVLSSRTNTPRTGQERTKTGLGGQGIFTMDGITFGLEVCLDHAKRRLRSSPPARGETHVQIQLIPSAGMSINQDSVVCVKRGIIFNVDGLGAGHIHVNRNIGDYGHPYLEHRPPGVPSATWSGASWLNGLNQAVSDWATLFQNTGYVAVFPSLPIPAAQKA